MIRPHLFKPVDSPFWNQLFQKLACGKSIPGTFIHNNTLFSTDCNKIVNLSDAQSVLKTEISESLTNSVSYFSNPSKISKSNLIFIFLNYVTELYNLDSETVKNLYNDISIQLSYKYISYQLLLAAVKNPEVLETIELFDGGYNIVAHNLA